MRYILFSFLCFYFAACSNINTNNIESSNNNTDTSVVENDTIEITSEFKIDSSKVAKIGFDEFTLFVWGVEIFEKQLNSADAYITHQDSSDIWLEFEQTPAGKYCSFLPSSLQITNVYQRYITTMIIKNQNTFLPLSDWKHYVSSYDTLEIKPKGFYLKNYTENDIINFPTFEVDELKEYVKVAGGEEWLKILTETKLKNETIFDFIIEEIEMLINYIDKTGKLNHKQIRFKLQYKGKV